MKGEFKFKCKIFSILKIYNISQLDHFTSNVNQSVGKTEFNSKVKWMLHIPQNYSIDQIKTKGVFNWQ